MEKNSHYTEANNKLNPFFQQHHPQGHVQAGDLAFFMRKNTFMLRSLQETILPGKKEDKKYNDDGRA